jgi:hypothetical protein
MRPVSGFGSWLWKMKSTRFSNSRTEVVWIVTGSDGSWMLREKRCRMRLSCGSVSLERTWCTRSASVEYASGRSTACDARSVPTSTFSTSSISMWAKNPRLKSVARMWRVATSSSLRVATVPAGHASSSAITAFEMASSNGFMSLVKPRRRYVKKESVFTWQANSSR